MLPPELPQVSNRALYAYRVFAKWLSFFTFGILSLLMTIFVLPFLLLVLHPRERFKKHIRRLISASMRFFISIMHGLGIVNVEVDDRAAYKNLSSKILVANHPSLLDVIMLLSLVPNADCIVNAYLKHNILTVIARQVYILGSLDHDKLFSACAESLKQGNCLIIFPEGTRTPRSGKIILKKGASRIALTSGCNIVPVHIGGTDKYGLGKKDPWNGFNPCERYIYRIKMLKEISLEKYQNYPKPVAVRILTEDVYTSLFPERIAAVL